MTAMEVTSTTYRHKLLSEMRGSKEYKQYVFQWLA